MSKNEDVVDVVKIANVVGANVKNYFFFANVKNLKVKKNVKRS